MFGPLAVRDFCPRNAAPHLVCLHIQLPIVWDDWIDASTAEYNEAARKQAKELEKKTRQYDRAVAKYQDAADEYEGRNSAYEYLLRMQAAGTTMPAGPRITKKDKPAGPPVSPEPPEPSPSPRRRMKPGEMENFLLLSSSLTIILGRTVYLNQLDKAMADFTEYLLTFAMVSPFTI